MLCIPVLHLGAVEVHGTAGGICHTRASLIRFCGLKYLEVVSCADIHTLCGLSYQAFALCNAWFEPRTIYVTPISLLDEAFYMTAW